MEFKRRGFLSLLFAAPAALIAKVWSKPDVCVPKTWDTIFTKSPITSKPIADGLVTLRALNDRICEKWPAFTGFKEGCDTIDIVGQVWPSGKRLVGPYINVTISGTDDVFRSGLEQAVAVADSKIRCAVRDFNSPRTEAVNG